MKLSSLTLVAIEWNAWNGFIFEILSIELDHFEGSFLGFHYSSTHFIFEIAFIQFEVKSPFI